jgi:hypothetical protein
MPEHGQYDEQAQKWFCGYWMSAQEWEDVHDYAPFVKTAAAEEEEGQQEDEERE